ncbi:T-cell receptor alpha chain V region PHDS58 [Heterocephalus glaber]|nr:T-cell receptor alpha chain V region PHDS58 [Heterocephalus glaber]
MLSVTLLLLGMPFTLRGSGAQSVAQPDRHVAVWEGDPLLLRCNYTYSGAPYLFWYVQYPGQGPQFLLRYMSGAPVVTGIRDFKAEFKKSETSFHLEKSSAHWSDTATYYCAVSGTVPGAAGGAEHKPPETSCDCRAPLICL